MRPAYTICVDCEQLKGHEPWCDGHIDNRHRQQPDLAPLFTRADLVQIAIEAFAMANRSDLDHNLLVAEMLDEVGS